MAKDVNIHIKATGGAEAKQQLEGVAQGAQKVGSGVQDMGNKALIGSGWVQKALSFLAGPLGFAGIAGAIAGVTIKAAKFFDDIKTRSDEAVQQVQEIRNAYAELFQVMNEFSEKGRQALTLETTALLKKTAVTQQVGLPIITAYARTFEKTGLMTGPQYKQGLEEMLRYAGRQGAGAVPEMIELMAGWEMITPQEQGAFRRMVAEAAQASHLTEEQLVGALSKGMPAFKVLGWTPEKAIIETAKIASTQITPRQRETMPAMLYEAIMSPQIPKEFEKKIPKEIQEDPAKLLDWIQQQRAIMPQKDYLKLLAGVYGAGTATGFYSWITARETGLGRIVSEAAGPAGAAREATQEAERQKTLEAAAAKTEAYKTQLELDTVGEEAERAKMLREIGEREKGRWEIQHPKRKLLRKIFRIPQAGGGLVEAYGEEAEKEHAAYRAWEESLSLEEKTRISQKQYPGLYGPGQWTYGALEREWQGLTYKQKHTALIEEPNRQPATIINNFIQTHDFNFSPVVGNRADLMGLRVPKNIH
jgi:hypothetical protein